MMILGLLGVLARGMRKAALCTGGVLFGGQLSLTLADTIDTRGMAPQEQCGYCHEYDGNSRMANFPKLAGQKHAYLVKQLQDFQSGRRDGKGMMQEAAALLSAQEVEAVAAHFAAQQRTREQSELDQAGYRLAEKIYHHGIPARSITACNSCHGAQDKTTPELFGQHARYLAEQLQAFRAGERSNDGQVMRRITAQLNDAEIHALSVYLAAGGQQQ